MYANDFYSGYRIKDSNVTFSEYFSGDKYITTALGYVFEDVSRIMTMFFLDYKKILLVGLVVIHGITLWEEKSKANREYLQTLPVKPKDRQIFRVLMDILLVVLSISISALVTYVYTSHKLAEAGLEIECLGSSIFGVAVTTICYVLIIVGFMHFIESMVVRGDMKIIHSIIGMGLLYFIPRNLFRCFSGNSFCQKLYGHVYLEIPGGCYYKEIIRFGLPSYSEWYHDKLTTNIIYQGEAYNATDLMSTGYRFIDFGNLSSYIGSAILYLAIALVLALVAIHLSGKQDLSKEGYYFKMGSIVMSILISVCLFGALLDSDLTTSNIILSILISLLIGFMYVFISNKELCKKLKSE